MFVQKGRLLNFAILLVLLFSTISAAPAPQAASAGSAEAAKTGAAAANIAAGAAEPGAALLPANQAANAISAIFPSAQTFTSPSAPTGGSPLAIPLVAASLKVDGICSEYDKAASFTFNDGGGKQGTVYFMYNGDLLYVCMIGQLGSFGERFARLYLDPQGDGTSYTFAQKDDYGLQVKIPDPGGASKSSYNGSGVANGWTADPSIDSFWNGAATADPAAGDMAEWSVNFGRFFIKPCQYFRMAVYHHWFSAVGDDYGWPSNQWFDQPGTWQLSYLDNGACGKGANGNIAYVFRGNTSDAVSFYNLLTGAGFSVTLVPLANVTTTDFAQFDLIIVADDSGDLNTWGNPAITAAQVDKITIANKPIIGVGEGGYAFFGKLALFIGWPQGWHGPEATYQRANPDPTSIFTAPNNLGVPLGGNLGVYGAPVNTVGIYLGTGSLPASVVPVAVEPVTPDHSDLILQGCRLLWGSSGNPLGMTVGGQMLFVNAAHYMRNFQCPPTTPPPPTCIKIEKSAKPVDGTVVHPGDVIEYTITYTYSDSVECQNPKEAKLLDTVPVDTTFVPGSATDGISPGADGSLVWVINSAAGTQTKTFQVVVSQNQCADQRRVNNRAGIIAGAHPPVISNVVSHPVECPPVNLPNNNPQFAEDEVQIHPYPLIVGKPSKISVRVTNNTSSPQPVNVAFQTSPDKFGIGLTFSTFDSRSVTLPANGSAIVEGVFVPAASGHYCIQIVITGPGLNTPLVTQRNLDVTEELVGGVQDSLTFLVANPTAAPATINLVVVNTCPGWIASVNPSVLTNVGANSADKRTVTLNVTPPNPVVLGSGCHIDVEGWIGSTLIGGIRKLDVPPVGLPHDVQPPWEEPEISFIPDPPVAGQPGQLCVFLQNPTGSPRTVTVDFAVADFGAGIGFTPVGTQTFTLPPNSSGNYCITWTPVTSGTTHRCVLVTLQQTGYLDQHSQRNVDIVRVHPGRLDTLDIPFVIGNPDLVDHTVVISNTLVGIDPFWKIKLLTDPGDPAPDMFNLPAGGMVHLHLTFVPAAGLAGVSAPLAPPLDYNYGDVSKVEVGIYFDGLLQNGFSVQLTSSRTYLPIIKTLNPSR